MLVGEHHRIDAAGLQGLEVMTRFFQHPCHPAAHIIGRVAGQGAQVTHGNNRLDDAK